MIAYCLLLIFPVVMLVAALSDLLTMTIPNRLSIILVLTFGPLAVVAGLPMEAVLTHLAVGVGILVVGFLLFSIGTLGGGDAKLLAAAGLWIGVANLFTFLLYVAVGGGVLALCILLYRRLPMAAAASGPAWVVRLHGKETGIPYGIAIAGAALLTLPQTELYALIMN